MRKPNDIKAPDGFLLGGLRRVRKDGTILFQRGWWELPDEVKPDFIGQDVWCHQEDIAKMDCGSDIVLEVAHPSLHIYEARSLKKTVIADRNERPDAKSGVRLQWRKDWENREHQPKEQS